MLIPDFYENRPHRRLNALTGEWVLVSPHRTQRPWHGQEEEAELQILPPYDPQCYLCPGNARAGGRKNPEYKKPYVFNNDFPAMLPDTDDPDVAPADDLLSAEPEPGICRVICYAPRHDLSMARMTVSSVQHVIDAWQIEYLELGRRPDIGHVQIFENRGLCRTVAGAF
jgi:UDPglucose--hexose-1-phosphate uridylyltransferase